MENRPDEENLSTISVDKLSVCASNMGIAEKKNATPDEKLKDETNAVLQKEAGNGCWPNGADCHVVRVAGVTFRDGDDNALLGRAMANAMRYATAHVDGAAPARRLSELSVGLQPEPHNKFDGKAVKVLVSGEFIGYWPKEKQSLHDVRLAHPGAAVRVLQMDTPYDLATKTTDLDGKLYCWLGVFLPRQA